MLSCTTLFSKVSNNFTNNILTKKQFILENIKSLDIFKIIFCEINAKTIPVLTW